VEGKNWLQLDDNHAAATRIDCMQAPVKSFLKVQSKRTKQHDSIPNNKAAVCIDVDTCAGLSAGLGEFAKVAF